MFQQIGEFFGNHVDINFQLNGELYAYQPPLWLVIVGGWLLLRLTIAVLRLFLGGHRSSSPSPTQSITRIGGGAMDAIRDASSDYIDKIRDISKR